MQQMDYCLGQVARIELECHASGALSDGSFTSYIIAEKALNDQLADLKDHMDPVVGK